MFRRGFVLLGVLHSSTFKLSLASSPSTDSSSSPSLTNASPLGITDCLRTLASRLPHDGVSMEEFKAYIDDDFPFLSEQINDKKSLLKVLAESSSLFRLKAEQGSIDDDDDDDDKEWHIWPATETLYKEELEKEEKESQNSKAEVLEEWSIQKEKVISIKKPEESAEKATCTGKTTSQMHTALHNSNINVSDVLADEVRSIMEHNRLPVNENLLRTNTTVPFISLNTILQSNLITQNNINKNEILESLDTISSTCGAQKNVKQQDEKEMHKEHPQKEKDESNLVVYTTIQIRSKQHTRSAYIFVDGDVLSGSDLEQMSSRMGIHPSQSHWYIFRPPVRAPLSNHDYMTHDVLPTYLCVERAVRELYMHKPDVLKDIVFMCADEQRPIYLDKISRRHVFRDANVFVCTPQQIKIVHKREVVPLNS